MSRVLFVCTGNTCRSPMAAALYKRLCPECEVSSAGLFSDGSEYCQNSIDALGEMGITLGGNSRQITSEDIDCDRIFVMTDSHKAALLSAGVGSDKITVLNVCDPFGGDMAVYRDCRDEIARKLCELSVDIRPMNKADIPAVATLERECFSAPWSENALLESLESGGKFSVAAVGERVVGYIGAQTALDEAYVTNVAVFPHYRGFGIGTRLVRDMTEFCRESGFAFLTLEVRESNKKAISVYEKAGFSPVGKRKNFYSDPKEDAVLMTKEFKA